MNDEFDKFAASELSDLDLSFITDDTRKTISLRRANYIERELDSFPFANRDERRKAKTLMENFIPDPVDPRFQGSINVSQAQSRLAAPAEEAAPAPLNDSASLGFLSVRDSRPAESRSAIERIAAVPSAVKQAGVSLIGSGISAAGGLGEFATRVGVGVGPVKALDALGNLALDDSKDIFSSILIDSFEETQKFGKKFKDNNSAKNLNALKERNAQIGKEQGIGARVADYVLNPELVSDLIGTSVGTVLGSGGIAGGARAGGAKLLSAAGGQSKLIALQKLGAKIPKRVRPLAGRAAQAAPIAAATAEINAGDVYEAVKDIAEDEAVLIPEYIQIKALMEQQGKTPAHDEVLEAMARRAERTAVRWGFGASLAAMSLAPQSLFIEKTFMKLPGAAIGRKITGVTSAPSRKSRIGNFITKGGQEALSEGFEEAGQEAARTAAIRSIVTGDTQFFEELGSEEALEAGALGGALGGLLGGSIGLVNINRNLNEELEPLIEKLKKAETREAKVEILRQGLTLINQAADNPITEVDAAGKRTVNNNIEAGDKAAFINITAQKFATDAGLTDVQSIINEVAYTNRGENIPEIGEPAVPVQGEVTQETATDIQSAAELDEDIANAVEYIASVNQDTIEALTGTKFKAQTDVNEILSTSEQLFKPQPASQVAPRSDAEFSTGGAIPELIIREDGGAEYRNTVAIPETDGGAFRISSPDSGLALFTTDDAEFAASMTKRIEDANLIHRLEEIDSVGIDAIEGAARSRPYRVPSRPTDSNVVRDREMSDEVRAKHNPEYAKARDSDEQVDGEIAQERMNSRLMAAANESQVDERLVLDDSKEIMVRNILSERAAFSQGGNSVEYYPTFEAITNEADRQDLSGPVSVVSDGNNVRVIIVPSAIDNEGHLKEAIATETAKAFPVDTLIGQQAIDKATVNLRVLASQGASTRLTAAIKEADEQITNDGVMAVRAAVAQQAASSFPDQKLVRWAMTEIKPALVDAGWLGNDATVDEVMPFLRSMPRREAADNVTGEAAILASREGTPNLGERQVERDNGAMKSYQMTGPNSEAIEAGKFLFSHRAIPATKTMQWMFGGQYNADIVAQLLRQNGIENRFEFLFMTHHDRVQERIRVNLEKAWAPVSQAIDSQLDKSIWETEEIMMKDFDLLSVALQTESRNGAYLNRKIPLKTAAARDAQEDVINQLLDRTITAQAAKTRLNEIITDETIDISALKKNFKNLKGKTDAEVLAKARSLSSRLSQKDANDIISQFTIDGKLQQLQPLMDAVVAANGRITELYREAGVTGTGQDRLFQEFDSIANFVTFRDGATAEDNPELDGETKSNWDFSKYDPFKKLGQAKGRDDIPRGMVRATYDGLIRAASLAEAQDFHREIFSQMTATQQTADILGVSVSNPLKMKFKAKKGKLPRLSVPGLKSLKPNEFVVWTNGVAQKVTVNDEHMAMALNDLYRPIRQKDSFGFEGNAFEKGIDALTGVKIGIGKRKATIGQLTRFNAALLTRHNPTFWPVQIIRDIRQVIPAVATENIGGLNAAMRASMEILSASNWHKVSKVIRTINDPILYAQSLTRLEKGNKTEKYMAEFFRNGGASIFAAAQTGTQRENPASFISSDRQATINTGTNNNGILRRINRFTEVATNTMDNVPRLAAYVSLREQGVTVDRAAEFAKGQINFQQTSQMARYYGDAYAFAGTALAGGYSTYFRRIWKDGRPPVSFVQKNGRTVPVLKLSDVPANLNTSLIAGYAVNGFIAYNLWSMMQGDDEEGNRLSRRSRDKDFLVGFPSPVLTGVNRALGGQGLIGEESSVKTPTQYGVDQVATYLGIMAARIANGDTTMEEGTDYFSKVVVPMLNQSFQATNPVGRLSLSGSIFPEEGQDYKPAENIMLALIPTIFEPMARNYANQSAFGGPVRADSGGFGGNVNADNGFFSTPQFYEDMALNVREATKVLPGDGIDWSPETYEYFMRSYSGILGETVTDIIEHSNVRAYAPSTTLFPLPVDKSRYYYETSEKFKAINRLAKAYKNEYELLADKPEERDKLKAKNPEYDTARKAVDSHFRSQAETRKLVKQLERQPMSIARNEKIHDLMSDMRKENLVVAQYLTALMDKGGDVKR